MRVISGTLGGRQFDSPKGHRTHPMSDKVRGGLFNALGDIQGLTLLDAFAGSGAICFEAISRGALSAVAIDSDKNASTTIKANIEKLGIQDQVKATQANISSWSDNNIASKFDLVICDPPYDQKSEKLISKLTKHVKPEGLLVLSWPGGQEVPMFDKLDNLKVQNYGDAQLAFYRQTE